MLVLNLARIRVAQERFEQVYTPDQNAFRAFAQKKYLDKYANDWPKGAIEKINAIK